MPLSTLVVLLLVTLPSHAALFTGLYDSAHGLTDNGMRLSGRHTMLAEILKTAGANNALTRYARRVNNLKFYAQDLDKSMTSIEDNLNKIAERDDAPIIQVTAAEKAEEKPAEGEAAVT